MTPEPGARDIAQLLEAQTRETQRVRPLTPALEAPFVPEAPDGDTRVDLQRMLDAEYE
jgi:hypothetical protein